MVVNWISRKWKLEEMVYKLLIKFQRRTDLETLSDLPCLWENATNLVHQRDYRFPVTMSSITLLMHCSSQYIV
jgi:hypothetical protein